MASQHNLSPQATSYVEMPLDNYLPLTTLSSKQDTKYTTREPVDTIRSKVCSTKVSLARASPHSALRSSAARFANWRLPSATKTLSTQAKQRHRRLATTMSHSTQLLPPPSPGGAIVRAFGNL